MGNTKSILSYEKNVNNIIDNLELVNLNDNIMLKHRFLEEVILYEKKREYTRKYYNVFRFIVTIGSIFLPALLSIGQMDPTKLPRHFNTISYWCAWGMSLTVTTSNGFIQLFSLDKNYFTYSIVAEQLKSEGWQYFQLSGKYHDFDDHIECYKMFCKSVESIKRKQIENEFSGGKAGDTKKKINDKKIDTMTPLIDKPISENKQPLRVKAIPHKTDIERNDI
jgi:hypothetical protein